MAWLSPTWRRKHPGNARIGSRQRVPQSQPGTSGSRLGRGGVSVLELALGTLALWPLGVPVAASVDGAQSEAVNGGPKGIGRQAESLLLEVQINGNWLASIYRAERLADGRLALPVEAWSEARLRPPGTALELPDGQRGYALESVPSLEYQLDRGRMRLEIKAPSSAFELASFGLGGSSMPVPTPPPFGVYLNYDLSATQSRAHYRSYGAFVEGVAFNTWGTLVSGAVARGDDISREIIRTDTYWRKDLPGRMETLVIGDTLGSGGAWSQPVHYGGIRWARDFSLAPGFITYPMLTLQGSAALPSTVEVLVNNQRQTSDQKIGSGPFELTDVPVVTGAGQVNLVVRDLRGVETVISQSYYLSPRLLAVGLSDFSVEAGALRLNYGMTSNDYSQGFAAAGYRYGLTPALTVGGRLELQKERQAGGLEVTGLLGHLGVLGGAVAWSRSEDGTSGGHYLAGFERTSPGIGASLAWEYFDSGYRQFAALEGEPRPKDRVFASAGLPLGANTSLGMSYVHQTTWEGERFSQTGASFGLSLPHNLYLSAYVNKQLDGDKEWSGGISLIMSFEKQRSVVASSNRNADGSVTNAIQATQSLPIGPGWGWRLRASDNENQQFQAGAALNTNYGQFTAETNFGKDTNALRLSANGALGWMEGLPFASRRIDDAFAVVRVADLEGVPIYRANQVAATTNGQGMALVTGLLAYQKNILTIEPGDLPFDVDIGGVKEVAIPYARSGSLVEFPVRRTRNALVVLRQPNGSPVPAGARVTLTPGTDEFIVAKRGEVYLMNLQNENSIEVNWKGGRCTLAVNLQPGAAAEPRIGPLVCGGGR